MGALTFRKVLKFQLSVKSSFPMQCLLDINTLNEDLVYDKMSTYISLIACI